MYKNAHPKHKPKRFNLSTKGGRKAWQRLKDKVWARDRGICQICYRTTVVPEYHHTIFKSQGGEDTLENVILLCFPCHHSIHNGSKDAHKNRKLAEKRMEEINETNV